MPLRWYDLSKLVSDNVTFTEIFEEYTHLDLYPTDQGWLTACPLKQENKFSFTIFKDNKSALCLDCKFQGPVSSFLALLGKMTIFEAAFTILLKKGVLLPEGYDNFKTCGELVEQYLKEQKEDDEEPDKECPEGEGLCP